MTSIKYNNIYNYLINNNENNNDDNDLDDDVKYCNKCLLRREATNTKTHVEIFDKITDIVFNSTTMPNIYCKMDKLNIPFRKWLELNDDGYSVFHWFAWYISVKIKKYIYIKPRVYAFFQKVFGDNTVTSIFSNDQIKTIIKLTNPNFPSHNIMYHLVRYCENANDIFYSRLYKILIDSGIEPLTSCQMNEINKLNNSEEQLPNDLKTRVSEITNSYKLTEELIIKNIEEKCIDYTLKKCADCGSLVDFIKEIPKIITYAKKNSLTYLLDLIQNAYCQRRLLNKIFNKYYKMTNYKAELNMIHKRHSHVLEVYANNLVACD